MAGTHIYCETGDVISGREAFTSTHATAADKQALMFPKATELRAPHKCPCQFRAALLGRPPTIAAARNQARGDQPSPQSGTARVSPSRSADWWAATPMAM